MEVISDDQVFFKSSSLPYTQVPKFQVLKILVFFMLACSPSSIAVVKERSKTLRIASSTIPSIDFVVSSFSSQSKNNQLGK